MEKYKVPAENKIISKWPIRFPELKAYMPPSSKSIFITKNILKNINTNMHAKTEDTAIMNKRKYFLASIANHLKLQTMHIFNHIIQQAFYS